jgi:hypothetical protein
MGTPATVEPALPSGESTPAQRLQAVRDSLVKPAADILALGTERTRLVDALLGTTLLYAYLLPGVGAFSVGLGSMALLIGLSVTRRPRFALDAIGWVVAGMLLAVGYAVLISMSSPDESFNGWPQRALRLVGVILFLASLVSGRVHYPSVIRGVGIGLVANAVLFYAGVAPAPYGSALSGYLLDKNQAGLASAVVGVLLLGVVGRRRERVVVLAVATLLVWETGSRTSLAALGCGVLWFVARPYLAPAARFATAAAMAYGLTFVQENYAQAGEFRNRAGSDLLRERIDELSAVKVQAAPWWGQGLGEAWVPLDQGNFFFHNAYWSLLVEGGWPYLIALVAPLVLINIRPFRRGAPPSALALSAEAGAIVVIVCALRLGEVFGATAAMVTLAAGCIGYLQVVEVQRRSDRDTVSP